MRMPNGTTVGACAGSVPLGLGLDAFVGCHSGHVTVMDDLIRRVDHTLAESAGRFPMTADPGTGEWTWSSDGAWCGGFWVGLLELAARASGSRHFNEAADDFAARLVPRVASPTVMRGFLFWYGAALARRPDTACEAAALLAADFDTTLGVVPPGTDDVTLYAWPRPGACIDAVPGTVQLLRFAGYTDLAEAHARNTYRLCARPDGALLQCADHDGAFSENGASPTSIWSRGHAWGMLGLVQAGLTSLAASAADWWLANVPADRVAYWDFSSTAVRDTSATAIAAAAMARLGGPYRDAARATVDALMTAHRNADGVLVDGCTTLKSNDGTFRHELIWGDYFLLEALLELG
jgi:unsaturated chondroitin disaccharide hydrolase